MLLAFLICHQSIVMKYIISILDDDPRLAIHGYNLIRCDHPSNLRRGGVCLYFKDYLSLVRRSDLTSLDECLVCEIQTGTKHFFLTVIYRSPSKDIEQFSLVKQKLEETIVKSVFFLDCTKSVH